MKKLTEEGLNLIHEQLRIRLEMRKMGYLSWEDLGHKLGITRQGIHYLVKREIKKFIEFRNNHLTSVK